MAHWHPTMIAMLKKINQLITDDKMHDIIKSSYKFITLSRTSAAIEQEELLADDPLLLLGVDNGDGQDSEADTEGKIYLPYVLVDNLTLDCPTTSSHCFFYFVSCF